MGASSGKCPEVCGDFRTEFVEVLGVAFLSLARFFLGALLGRKCRYYRLCCLGGVAAFLVCVICRDVVLKLLVESGELVEF